MQFHYKAETRPAGIPPAKLPASPIQANQGDPARPLAALTPVLTEPRTQERRPFSWPPLPS